MTGNAVTYDEFLKSDEWQELRKATFARAKYLCEYCKEPADHVHHVRYPKKGQKHTLDMLVSVCTRCHDISHGAKEMDALTNPKNTTLAGPYDNAISVYHANGLIWASIEQWMKVLQAPYFMLEFLSRNADMQAALLKGGQYSATCGGMTVYRWIPIAAALDLWHRQWMVKVSEKQHVAMPTTLRAESEKFARSIFKLKTWGWELQEKELQAALKARMTPEQSDEGIVDTKQAMIAIQNLAQASQVVFEDHDKRIAQQDEDIKQIKKDLPAYRDPEEFISIKQRCLELCLPFAIRVQGQMNLTQACGQYLKQIGAQQGSKQMERLDGRSLTVPVDTWKRNDIDIAVKYYMPSPDSPSQLDLY